jgi:hypothetical protein
MKIFVSWSGARSRAVAELLCDWIRCVLQAARPWISTRDLDRGSLWFTEIAESLHEAGIGIVCLTQENKDRPWLLFEAGAIMKGLSKARVCTLLVDLEPKDIQDPLAQFNHTSAGRESMRGLVETINRALGGAGLETPILDRAFNTYWPQFDSEFQAILKKKELAPGKPPTPRTEADILDEILLSTREMRERLSKIEQLQPPFRHGPPAVVDYALGDPPKGIDVHLQAGAENVALFLKMCRELGIRTHIIRQSQKKVVVRIAIPDGIRLHDTLGEMKAAGVVFAD